MLNRHMSNPRWTTAQEAEADRLCVGVENELEGLLYGAHITPVPMVETVPFDSTGRLATSMPIARVMALGILAVETGEDGPVLPAGYSLRGHWLHYTGAATGLDDLWRTRVEPTYSAARVEISYLGGWGAEPALVEAILRKAARRMSGRHADTIVVTGLSGQGANAPASESPNFTEADLAALGRYRALGWGAP